MPEFTGHQLAILRRLASQYHYVILMLPANRLKFHVLQKELSLRVAVL